MYCMQDCPSPRTGSPGLPGKISSHNILWAPPLASRSRNAAPSRNTITTRCAVSSNTSASRCVPTPWMWATSCRISYDIMAWTFMPTVHRRAAARGGSAATPALYACVPCVSVLCDDDQTTLDSDCEKTRGLCQGAKLAGRFRTIIRYYNSIHN